MKLVPFRNRSSRREMLPARPSTVSWFDPLDSWFDRFFDEFHAPLTSRGNGLGTFPRMDIAESDDELTVTLDVAGVAPEEIEIELHGDRLVISGEKQTRREGDTKSYHFVERESGRFERSVQLPSGIDPERVKAETENGVLVIHLGKRDDARPKKIEIRSS